MIADSLSNWSKYNLGKAFAKAFKCLEGMNAGTSCGRHDVDGDNVYINVFEYATENAIPDKLEVHRKYIDIQITLSGRETVGWILNRGLKLKTPYDAAKDVEFLHMSPELVKFDLDAETFAIFLPQDAHIGKIAPASGPATIKKAVVKVAAELLGK
jgi:biofilm protein TabA